MNESEARTELVRLSKSLFDRGFAVGSAGNISVRLADGMLITPTNSCLGFLEADEISKLDGEGHHISGAKPSKEVFLHQAFYETRPSAMAVVHLHSTYATALSCIADIDPNDTIPAVTPYVVMRVGRVPLIEYVTPGDARLGVLIRELRGEFAAVLLANHGPVVSGIDLRSAVYAAEELEETAKLAILLRREKLRTLSAADIAELEAKFRLR